MTLFSITMLSCSAVLLVVAAFLFLIYRIFEYSPEKTSRTLGVLVSAKHKKDVPVYERSGHRAPRRIVMIIKNMTKGRYEYTVDGKSYRVRYTEFVKPRRMPTNVWVVYIKSMPRISYVKADTNFNNFEVYSFAALMFAVLGLIFGLYPVLA